jgi:hypothetical protein
MNKIIRQIEENYKRNESRKFFSEIKKLKYQNTRLPYMCKDGNNTVITQTNQILTRWKEYFCTILKSDTEIYLATIEYSQQHLITRLIQKYNLRLITRYVQ